MRVSASCIKTATFACVPVRSAVSLAVVLTPFNSCSRVVISKPGAGLVLLISCSAYVQQNESMSEWSHVLDQLCRIYLYENHIYENTLECTVYIYTLY
jgi:hypothetical protein